MSEASRSLGASAEQNKVGPDYFGFYTRGVAGLFAQDDDLPPFSSQTCDFHGRTRVFVKDKDIIKHNYSANEGNCFTGSLFCDVLGTGILDFKKDRLKALLRQCVVALTQEVDEMLDPVFSMRRIQSYLRSSASLSSNSGAACEGEVEPLPQKKLKSSSSSSSISIPPQTNPVNCRVSGEDLKNECMDLVLPGKGLSNGIEKKCSHCHVAQSPCWRTGQGPKSLCNACGIKFRQGKLVPKEIGPENEPLSFKNKKEECILGLKTCAEKENEEVNDDLQYLLEIEGSKVEEVIKKHSDELSATLGYMEQKLEDLLDTLMSNCRLMTPAEKRQLRKLIQKLPPRNLDRVVEIIRRRKPSERYSDEIYVDLEEADNVMLWRLYFYVGTVENAVKLSE